MAFDERRLIFEDKPVKCAMCGGKLSFFRQGSYKCEKCGEITYDDFGKIKKFLEENGPSPAVIISKGTGVPITKITELLREGRIEAPGMRNL